MLTALPSWQYQVEVGLFEPRASTETAMSPFGLIASPSGVPHQPATYDTTRRWGCHAGREDSDIAATRHARAFVGGVVADLVRCTDLFVLGGAEHQEPGGGRLIAVIAAMM